MASSFFGWLSFQNVFMWIIAVFIHFARYKPFYKLPVEKTERRSAVSKSSSSRVGGDLLLRGCVNDEPKVASKKVWPKSSLECDFRVIHWMTLRFMQKSMSVTMTFIMSSFHFCLYDKSAGNSRKKNLTSHLTARCRARWWGLRVVSNAL